MGLIIDQPFLRQLDIDPKTEEVEISVEQHAIVIRAHRYASDDAARAAGQKILQKRRKLMERLAR